MSNLEQQRLFEEYRELGLNWRADDERLSKLTRIILPISFAALVFSEAEPEISAWMPIGIGLVLMIYWGLAAHITVEKIKIWQDRMRGSSPLKCGVMI